MRHPASASRRAEVYEGASSTLPEKGGRDERGLAGHTEELGEFADLGPGWACSAGRDLRSHPLKASALGQPPSTTLRP